MLLLIRAAHRLKLGQCAFIALAGAALPASAEEAAPKAPPIPPIISIQAQPAQLTLQDDRDSRSFIVTGKTARGYSVDLSPLAHAKADGKIARIDSEGFVHGVRPGKTHLLVTAGGKTTSIPVIVQSISSPPVSFVREVEPLVSKVGCNMGTCHGSAKGKNGFKLSLRGYDPDYDYHSLVDDISGRRFNRSDPAQSLMLLKPTASVPHRGGMLFKPTSPVYALLKRWISEGVKNDSDHIKRVARIELLPAIPNVTLPGMTQKTIVIAHYPDGSTRDVSREAVASSSLPEVATVKPDGTLTAIRRGEAALLVRYEGTYAANNVTVLDDRTGYQWASVPEYNYIDTLVDRKLQKFKALAAPVCDDATFLRRVSIDLTGLPPGPEAARAFITDSRPSRTKRAEIVDKLMASPEFVDRWTNKWADLLSVNSKYLGDQGVRKFRNWIRSAVAENMPYDKFVRSMMTASGDAFQQPQANYMRVIRDTSTATENVTQLFLGVRFSCAKCHDHPFERWTQNQYYQLGAFFAQVGYKPGQAGGNEVVFNTAAGEVMHPKTGAVVAPLVPVGHMVTTAALGDRRAAFASWLTSPENPFFSRAMANRLWSYFLGKGIIDPVDDIRASNPPSNPELLEALNKEFVSSGFNLQKLMRSIVLSRVYQQTISTNRWNADDRVNFSHAVPRRLEAEQLLDAINQATLSGSTFAGMPAGTRADQLPDAAANGADGFLDLFGKPARQSPCECERSSTVSLGQALSLINGPTISDAISNPKGRVATMMQSNPSDKKLVEDIFLSTLSRFPTAPEMKTSLKTLHSAPRRMDGAQDLMWALINSPAFLFNR